jgi:predicted peptidase
MSMGGFGTWALANRMPDRFAAICPMCGGGDIKWAFNLSHIPIWVFHGSNDTVVPVLRSELMVNALKMINKQLKFSLLMKRGHDISEQFNNDELYAWLKQFSLKKISFWEEPLPFLKTLDKIKIVTHPLSDQIALSQEINPLRIKNNSKP